MADFRDVDPRELRLPPSRREGADPEKLARQIFLFGRSTAGMSPPWVYEGADGFLMLYNGVTRAARIARLAPGTLIRVEVIGKLPKNFFLGPANWRLQAMSDTQREAMSVLAEVWSLSPDVRLGQLMAHLGFLGEVHVGHGLGYMEDDELIAILYRHRAELIARTQGNPDDAPAPTGPAVSVSGSVMPATAMSALQQ
jgi:hypothetical protein